MPPTTNNKNLTPTPTPSCQFQMARTYSWRPCQRAWSLQTTPTRNGVGCCLQNASGKHGHHVQLSLLATASLCHSQTIVLTASLPMYVQYVCTHVHCIAYRCGTSIKCWMRCDVWHVCLVVGEKIVCLFCFFRLAGVWSLACNMDFISIAASRYTSLLPTTCPCVNLHSCCTVDLWKC